MKLNNHIRIIALILLCLIVSLPISFAYENNLVYDANGNLVTGDSFYREYNELNQLGRIRQGNTSTGTILEEFKWHPIENRVLIKYEFYSNGTKKSTTIYVNKNYVYIKNESGSFKEKYVYQDNILVAQVNTDGQKQAIHSDYEGSNTLITDVNGNVVENTFYSPYGEIIEGGQSSRYDYEAKEFDPIVGDYDFHARKYLPGIGFGQPDMSIHNVYDPQALNRYSFELNNPMKYTDPDGKNPILAWAFTYAFVAGATSYWINTPVDPNNPQWAERLGLGALHGVNWGVNAVAVAAASTLSLSSGGFLKFSGSGTLEAVGASALGLASTKLWDATIDQNQIELNRELAADYISNAASQFAPGFQVGGQIAPTVNYFGKQSLKYLYNSAVQTFSEKLLAYTINLFANQNQANANLASSNNLNQNAKGSSGGGGYVPGKGYVTSDGRTYPTSNPNFRPNPNAPRVCVSGCKK